MTSTTDIPNPAFDKIHRTFSNSVRFIQFATTFCFGVFWMVKFCMMSSSSQTFWKKLCTIPQSHLSNSQCLKRNVIAHEDYSTLYFFKIDKPLSIHSHMEHAESKIQPTDWESFFFNSGQSFFLCPFSRQEEHLYFAVLPYLEQNFFLPR